MPVALAGPLDEKDYQQINKWLDDQAALRVDIDKALAAGCPADDQHKHCQFLLDRLQKIKATYFPDRP